MTESLFQMTTNFQTLHLYQYFLSILGMNLFGCKFCEQNEAAGGEVECDRKNFDSLLWALVTVFQILTQEDWNVVLFNGMEKTSHWAALYFVTLMTFGNYVLFNLLVAILVEGFSSERHERREREQRELVKAKLNAESLAAQEQGSDIYDDPKSFSESTTSDSYNESKGKWFSAEELRKIRDIKCNIQKQRLLQPGYDDINLSIPKLNSEKDAINSIDLYSSRKQKKCEPLKLYNIHIADPPIITTTSATPQDSPNETLEEGVSFKDWENIDFEQLEKSSNSTLLKPPPVLGSLKALDDRSYFEGMPVLNEMRRKSEKLTSPYSEFKSSQSDRPQQHSQSIDDSRKSETTRKSSLKYRKEVPKEDEVLNNGKCVPRVGGSTLFEARKIDPLSQKSNRIQNDTQKDRCHSSRRSSVRRSSSIKIDSGPGSIASNISAPSYSKYMYNDKNKYYINRKSSLRLSDIKSPNNARRMSSIEHTYHKHSRISVHNLELRKIQEELTKNKLNNESVPSEQDMLPDSLNTSIEKKSKGRLKQFFRFVTPKNFVEDRDLYTLYIFPEHNRFRQMCSWFVNQKWFDNVILLFIALNCITLAMERPNIPPTCSERYFLATANYVFTVVFAVEMFIKVVATGMFYGPDAYFTSGWNIMDGSLVTISIIDLLMSLISESSPRIFGILRVFRLLRSLRPLRVINRAPGLKLVVQTLLSSLRPIGNIVLICCTFFIIFGILGVQLFKGTFFYCEGENIKGVKNKTDCLAIEGNVWLNRKYNFDDLGKALMSLFVLSSRDGWVNIMYTGLDAVGVDQQPVVNYNEWRLLYFIAFILLVGFFVLNMFVGVVVENFHRCREEQEKEEKILRAAKRALQMEKKRRRMHEPPYYTNYSPLRLFVHNVVTSKYFDLAIAAVIGLNVVTMAMEYYMMPLALEYALKIFNYFFTAVFILEAIMKLVALGLKIYMKDKWNQLDVAIVILSIVGIVLEELETNIIPINPTIIRVMRVLRIARVLKLLKMAKGIRALLDTVMQALPQVGNLGLLFFLLFFIFAALGVELFGRLECSEEIPCQGLGEHAHFANFGMAFLTLFRVATGDNWNGIMKDTLRDDCDDAADCVKNCCVSTIIAPIFFVIFVLMAQFVLVNVVVAVLMKHLEESHKQMEDDLDIETELEREFEREQEFEEEQALCMQLDDDQKQLQKRPLTKVSSLPSNFTYSTPIAEKRSNILRRQTIQYINQNINIQNSYTNSNSYDETAENDIPNEDDESFNSVNESSSAKNTNKKIHINKSFFSKNNADKRASLDEFSKPHKIVEELEKNDKISSTKSANNWRENQSEQAQKESESNIKLSCPTIISSSKPLAKNSKTDYRQLSLDHDAKMNIIHDSVAIVPGNSAHFPNTSNTLNTLGGTKSFLSVPKLQPKSRSGSTKQLFKQVALDEENETNESSLLLPSVSNVTASSDDHSYDLLTVQGDNYDAVRKSESCEILRIISERRKL